MATAFLVLRTFLISFMASAGRALCRPWRTAEASGHLSVYLRNMRVSSRAVVFVVMPGLLACSASSLFFGLKFFFTTVVQSGLVILCSFCPFVLLCSTSTGFGGLGVSSAFFGSLGGFFPLVVFVVGQGRFVAFGFGVNGFLALSGSVLSFVSWFFDPAVPNFGDGAAQSVSDDS